MMCYEIGQLRVLLTAMYDVNPLGPMMHLKALDRQAFSARQEKRFGKLRDAVRRLNESRRLISKKVDILCNDLVSAYGELSRQLDGVRTQEGFRKYVEKAKDLEQLLCHAMDWMLRQMGYANVVSTPADKSKKRCSDSLKRKNLSAR